MRAETLRFHSWLNSASESKILPKVSVPRRPTMKPQGYLLKAEGAQRAASMSERSSSSPTTWSAANPRGLHRLPSSSWMGLVVVFRWVMIVTGVPSCQFLEL